MRIHPKITAYTDNLDAQKMIQITRNLNAVFVSLPRLDCDDCEFECCEKCSMNILFHIREKGISIIKRLSERFYKKHPRLDLSKKKDIYRFSEIEFPKLKRIQAIYGLKGIVKYAKGISLRGK